MHHIPDGRSVGTPVAFRKNSVCTLTELRPIHGRRSGVLLSGQGQRVLRRPAAPTAGQNAFPEIPMLESLPRSEPNVAEAPPGPPARDESKPSRGTRVSGPASPRRARIRAVKVGALV